MISALFSDKKPMKRLVFALLIASSVHAQVEETVGVSERLQSKERS